MAEVEGTDSFLVMTAVEEVIDKGLMTGIEEDSLLLDPNPEEIILHKVPINSKKIMTMEVRASSSDLEVHPDLLPGGLELHLGHPIGIMTDVLATGDVAIFPVSVLRKTLL